MIWAISVPSDVAALAQSALASMRSVALVLTGTTTGEALEKADADLSRIKAEARKLKRYVREMRACERRRRAAAEKEAARWAESNAEIEAERHSRATRLAAFRAEVDALAQSRAA